MKAFIQLLVASTIFICVSCQTINRERTDTSLKEIAFADPTIFVENNKYYLTGTRNKTLEPLGFSILESTDLKEWKTANRDSLQFILQKGESTYGEKGFWAPQILKERNKYYLTYTASEHTVLASSNSVFGPFKQESIRPIDDSARNIDSFLFKDSDGKYYLYHVRFNKGNYLWVAEFDLQRGSIKPETLKKCFDITEPWEATPNYKSSPVMEGPTVIKLDEIYYLFYSANHFQNIDYAVGYATAKSPYGPWTKHANNPIIHRSIVHENGSGHGDVFQDLNNRYYYVYHVHNSDSVVHPRKTRIVPLILKKNQENGIYDISVDQSTIITPKTN